MINDMGSITFNAAMGFLLCIASGAGDGPQTQAGNAIKPPPLPRNSQAQVRRLKVRKLVRVRKRRRTLVSPATAFA